jgi:hypothetical protein
MKKHILLFPMISFLPGCQTTTNPLLFVVTHTVGLDVQATSATSATPGITFGYKSIDLAVVPLQMDKQAGDKLTGCYTVAYSG